MHMRKECHYRHKVSYCQAFVQTFSGALAHTPPTASRLSPAPPEGRESGRVQPCVGTAAQPRFRKSRGRGGGRALFVSDYLGKLLNFNFLCST